MNRYEALWKSRIAEHLFEEDEFLGTTEHNGIPELGIETSTGYSEYLISLTMILARPHLRRTRMATLSFYSLRK
jgi:hypothetical protein